MHTTRTTLALLFTSSLLASLACAQDAAEKTTVTTGAVAPASAANDIGISSRDGITLSGRDVLVTRNGVTERLTKEMVLPNGIRVLPNGTFLTSEGAKLTMRPSQVMTFEGKLLNAPVSESVPARTGVAGTTTTTTTTAPAAVAVESSNPANPAAADAAIAAEAARVEAERRSKAAAGAAAPKVNDSSR